MRGKWVKRIVFVLCIAAAIFVARATVFAPKPVPIEAYTVNAGKVEETVSNSKAGTVKARRRAQLSPSIGGRVVYLKAKEGEHVKAGDLLLQLEDSEYRANLQLSERAAQAARANQQEACVAEQLAERELKRNQTLHQQGIVSESVLDQLSNQRDAAKARCDASSAETRRAEASIDVARSNLEKTELRAPFDGVVVQVTTELGEWITPSPPGVPIPAIIDLVDNSSIYIEAPIDETDSSKLHSGLPTRITLESYGNQIFPGHVTRIADFVRDVEGQNRTVDVEAEFNQEEFARKLLPGTSADLEVVLHTKNNVLRIPTYALLEGNRVLIIQNERLVARDVKAGLRNWEFVEIENGLSSGDRIAVSLDRADVKEGARVRVTQEVTK